MHSILLKQLKICANSRTLERNCTNCSEQIDGLKLLLNREFTKIRQEVLAEVKFYSRTVSPQLNVLLDNFSDLIQLNESSHKQFAATILETTHTDYTYDIKTSPKDQPLLVKDESDDDDDGQAMLVPDDSSCHSSSRPASPIKVLLKVEKSMKWDPFAADDDDDDDSSSRSSNDADRDSVADNTDLIFPALCEFCPERFDNITEFNNHTHEQPRRTNSDRRQNAICDICAKICSNVFVLRSHYTTHFERSRMKCDICKRTCASRSSLKRHMLSHNNERAYGCQVCSKQFNMSESLKCHMRVHTGDKPYKCSYCDKAFTAQHHMKAHMHIHTGDMPYACPMCRTSFRDRFSVRRHLSRDHDVPKEDMAIVFPNKFQLLIAKEES